MQADVGLPVDGEVLQRVLERDDELVEPLEVRRLRAFGSQHRHAELDRHPLVAGLAPAREHLRGWRVGRRLWVRDERASPAPTRGIHVPALAERRQRLTQRRAGDAQTRAQLALGRQAVPGASSPSLIAVPSRSTVSSKAVCERTGAKTAAGEEETELTNARTPDSAPSR